jgi:hypothetical protein
VAIASYLTINSMNISGKAPLEAVGGAAMRRVIRGYRQLQRRPRAGRLPQQCRGDMQGKCTFGSVQFHPRRPERTDGNGPMVFEDVVGPQNSDCATCQVAGT